MKFIVIRSDGETYTQNIEKKAFLENYDKLKTRDINLIDRTLQFKDSDIISKKNVVVVKLYYLRCIITSDRVFCSR